MIILISGTSRSGKSLYAENRLEKFASSHKIYVAVSKIVDDEMRRRVQIHKERRRQKNFITLEKNSELSFLSFPKNSSVLIESLTVWAANEMFRDDGIKNSEEVCEKIYRDFLALKKRSENIIIVSDDVFSDGIIYDYLTEEYLRTLASLTKKIAALADEVIECISGLCIHYKINYNYQKISNGVKMT